MGNSLLTDDLAYDDINCASGELRDVLQRLTDNYNLSESQLRAAIDSALLHVIPDDRDLDTQE